MICVPPYKKHLEFSSRSSRHLFKSSSFVGTLLTGTLSPVSILSFTIASPTRRKRSAGKMENWESDIFTISPGTSSVESHSIPVYRVTSPIYPFREQDVHSLSRNTTTLQIYRDISRMRVIIWKF